MGKKKKKERKERKWLIIIFNCESLKQICLKAKFVHEVFGYQPPPPFLHLTSFGDPNKIKVLGGRREGKYIKHMILA